MEAKNDKPSAADAMNADWLESHSQTIKNNERNKANFLNEFAAIDDEDDLDEEMRKAIEESLRSAQAEDYLRK